MAEYTITLRRHLAKDNHRTYCGRPLVSVQPQNLTAIWSRVTCRTCLAGYEKWRRK